jgi:hypothetical protein
MTIPRIHGIHIAGDVATWLEAILPKAMAKPSKFPSLLLLPSGNLT